MTGPELVARHLGQMTAMSEQEWPPIVEIDGFVIIEDRAYQGFDNDGSSLSFPSMWPARRFWCRSILVRRVSDGATGWAVGPQAEAYRAAVQMVLGRAKP